jgi:hypothetical protein
MVLKKSDFRKAILSQVKGKGRKAGWSPLPLYPQGRDIYYPCTLEVIKVI